MTFFQMSYTTTVITLASTKRGEEDQINIEGLVQFNKTTYPDLLMQKD
jgi:hypothetical protein